MQDKHQIELLRMEKHITGESKSEEILKDPVKDEMFVVYLYCDYRKEVDLQHLKVFSDRNEAIKFARKYSNEGNRQQEYVCIRGTEYDAEFIDDDEDDVDDNDEDAEKQKLVMDARKEKSARVAQAKQELQVKRDMWYIRIAVDKVEVSRADKA